jgi:3-carboxy-cis,cis-muconate cycloisomerase
MGDAGSEVASGVSRRLGLGDPLLPWHTNRVRTAEAASALGIVAGVAAKVSLDVALLMQTEVAEALEPAAPGRGGSSSMPHKRNPVGAATVNAAARRAHGLVGVVLGAMVQEHERGLGGWQAEWDTMTELLRLAGGAAATAAETVGGLEVRTDRMRDNLDATAGSIMTERISQALAPSLGGTNARSLVVEAARRASSSRRSLAKELLQEPAVAETVSEEELDVLLDPAGYLGSCEVFVERALEAHRSTGRRDG